MKANPSILTKQLETAGYKFLGWMNGWRSTHIDEDGIDVNISGKQAKHFTYTEEEYPEYRHCIDAKHHRDNIQHNPRGSENTVSCDICKIYWKYDCSD